MRELERTWRDSGRALQYVRDPGRRLELAELRRACLDEMEQRDPACFASWLAGDDVRGGEVG